MDSKGKAAGKGLLIQDNKASTLAVSQDQYVFAESYGVPLNFRPENTKVYEETATTICNGTNPGHHQGVMVIENHPMDNRCSIDDSGTVQTLTGRMGTGGNNTPMVMFSEASRARSSDDATTWKKSMIANTLNTFDLGEQRTNEIVTYCIGNGQRDSAHHMSAEKTGALDCMHDQKAIMTYSMQAIGEYKESDQGYIVRRLTPTECCRLQGFPDGWGELKPYSDDDYDFWKSIHPGTPAQVKKWYDKLHTDSSEYKMWGNGIALPCALYVFEGIEEEIRLAHESPDVAK